MDEESELEVNFRLSASARKKMLYLRDCLKVKTDLEMFGRVLSMAHTLASEVSQGGSVQLLRANGDVVLLNELFVENSRH